MSAVEEGVVPQSGRRPSGRATMASAYTVTVRPRFPLVGLSPHPLSCPKVGRPASALTKKICYYIHEYILIPFSLYWYMRRYKIESRECMFALPFGLILKRHCRVHEQEGLAMNLARAMGIPAPRCISFGSLGLAKGVDYTVCDSLLMTRVPGRPLETFNNDEVDWDTFTADLTRILARMRSFSNPFGDAVCGAAGGMIHGTMVPAPPLPRYANEDAFKEGIRSNFRPILYNDPNPTPEQVDQMLKSRAAAMEVLKTYFFDAPPHAIVFTHGDLNPQNIMMGADGRICALIDWEAAAWLPEYWEFSVTFLLPMLPWGKFMGNVLTEGVYADEIRGHQELIKFVELNGSYV
ncbi:kinase-like domain-containing protein [Lenzites betulinus]|nr:kinase-like domain-containing protein [Lenzites betulinus]